MRRIIDTNVMVVANREAQQVENDPVCILSCVDLLEAITKNGQVVLDDSWHVLGEYDNNLNASGQPGLGDSFFKWLLNNKNDPSYCEMFTITPLGDSGNFLEFPEDPELDHFDPDDRKFVALAVVSKAVVSTAVDPGWWQFRSALNRNGVGVEFLCRRFVEGYKR
jgi:hypothetical protein